MIYVEDGFAISIPWDCAVRPRYFILFHLFILFYFDFFNDTKSNKTSYMNILIVNDVWLPTCLTFHMMTSSNGNIFRVDGPLCGEFTGHRWILLTKASDAELWCFLWYAPWINGWVTNREAGDFRRHCAHYYVIVMNQDYTSTVLQLSVADNCRRRGGRGPYPYTTGTWGSITSKCCWQIYLNCCNVMSLAAFQFIVQLIL